MDWKTKKTSFCWRSFFFWWLNDQSTRSKLNETCSIKQNLFSNIIDIVEKSKEKRKEFTLNRTNDFDKVWFFTNDSTRFYSSDTRTRSMILNKLFLFIAIHHLFTDLDRTKRKTSFVFLRDEIRKGHFLLPFRSADFNELFPSSLIFFT